jgi:hypothetical protein
MLETAFFAAGPIQSPRRAYVGSLRFAPGLIHHRHDAGEHRQSDLLSRVNHGRGRGCSEKLSQADGAGETPQPAANGACVSGRRRSRWVGPLAGFESGGGDGRTPRLLSCWEAAKRRRQRTGPRDHAAAVLMLVCEDGNISRDPLSSTKL